MSIEVMRDLADERIYRRNAFHVTGLATTAGTREIRECRRRNQAALAVGADLPAPTGAPDDVAPDELSAAFETLGDARRRIVHELFWEWGENTSACGCPTDDHRAHDGAVRAHAAAVAAALAGDDGSASFTHAATKWDRTVHRESTWTHLRVRVRELDERRLDASVVDELRAELPRTLVTSVVVTALRAEVPIQPWVQGWGASGPECEGIVLDATAPLAAMVSGRLDEALRTTRDGRPRVAAAFVREQVLPSVRRLAVIAPAERFRHTAEAADRTAILLNNCALAIAEAQTVDRNLVLELYDEAAGLGPDEVTATTIGENRAAFLDRDRVDRVLAPFGLNIATDGVQKLFDAFLVALRGNDPGLALAACLALLQVSDDPQVTAQLRRLEGELRLSGAYPRARYVTGMCRQPVDLDRQDARQPVDLDRQHARPLPVGTIVLAGVLALLLGLVVAGFLSFGISAALALVAVIIWFVSGSVT